MGSKEFSQSQSTQENRCVMEGGIFRKSGPFCSIGNAGTGVAHTIHQVPNPNLKYFLLHLEGFIILHSNKHTIPTGRIVRLSKLC